MIANGGMLHLGLLPAFHLIARSVFCNGHQGASFSIRRCSRCLHLQPHSGLPKPTRKKSSSQLLSSLPTCGSAAVVHRSQSPTHLDDVEDAVDSSLMHYNSQKDPPQQRNILQFPPQDRETIGVATHLKRRLRGLATNGDCRRCWLQKAHCICHRCVPLVSNEDDCGRVMPNVNRLFLLVS